MFYVMYLEYEISILFFSSMNIFYPHFNIKTKLLRKSFSTSIYLQVNDWHGGLSLLVWVNTLFEFFIILLYNIGVFELYSITFLIKKLSRITHNLLYSKPIKSTPNMVAVIRIYHTMIIKTIIDNSAKI